MAFEIKRYVFLFLCVLFVFSLGFVGASYILDTGWTGPICSFNDGEITPLINEQYPKVVMNEINSARSNIDILMYEMKFYETNNSVRQLEDALISAKERGVKVRVLLDQSEWNKKITGLTKENWKTKDYLGENGIEVKLDSLKETTHTKLVIIDGQRIVIGSTNWGFSAFERNNEASVMISEKGTVEYFKNYFNFLWDKF